GAVRTLGSRPSRRAAAACLRPPVLVVVAAVVLVLGAVPAVGAKVRDRLDVDELADELCAGVFELQAGTLDTHDTLLADVASPAADASGAEVQRGALAAAFASDADAATALGRRVTKAGRPSFRGGPELVAGVRDLATSAAAKLTALQRATKQLSVRD